MEPDVLYYRDEQVDRYFARVVGQRHPRYGQEFRYDVAQGAWVALELMPVIGWLLDGDPWLEEVDASEVPQALAV
ncbi:MAG: hypothetical protein E6244_07460 [Actinomyces sp.]|nr:hypothetical protein [Actinomyces sp.]